MWQRFWFEPRPVSTAVLFRVAYGTLVFLWAVSVLPDAISFFGPSGVLAHSPHSAGGWSVLDLWNSDMLAVGLVVLVALAALCVIVGAFTRVASLVVLVGLISLSKRDPYIGNSGDALLRALAFYLVLMPAGDAVSVDKLRKARDHVREIPLRAPIGIRLVQVQISLLYVSTVWAKLRGHFWPHGTAVGYALRLEDLARFPMPDVGRSLAVTGVLTFGTLVVELSLGVLVWKRVLRPWVLAAGICLHLGIEYRLRVGFFSWAIITSYVAFIPEDVATRIIERGRALASLARRWPRSALTR